MCITKDKNIIMNKKGCYCFCICSEKSKNRKQADDAIGRISETKNIRSCPIADSLGIDASRPHVYNTQIYVDQPSSHKILSNHYYYGIASTAPTPNQLSCQTPQQNPYQMQNLTTCQTAPHDYQGFGNDLEYEELKGQNKEQPRAEKKHKEKNLFMKSLPGRQIDDSGIYDVPSPILTRFTLLRRKRENKDTLGNSNIETLETPTRQIDDENIYDVPTSIFKRLTLGRRKKKETSTENRDTCSGLSEETINKQAENTYQSMEESKERNEDRQLDESNTKTKYTKKRDQRKSKEGLEGENIYDVPSSIFKRLTLRKQKEVERKETTPKEEANDEKLDENNKKTKKIGLLKKSNADLEGENIYDVPSSIFKRLTLRRQKDKSEQKEATPTADNLDENNTKTKYTKKKGVFRKSRGEMEDENIYDVPSSIFKRLTLRKHKEGDRKDAPSNERCEANEHDDKSLDESNRKMKHNKGVGLFKKSRQDMKGEDSTSDVPSSIIKRLTQKRQTKSEQKDTDTTCSEEDSEKDDCEQETIPDDM